MAFGRIVRVYPGDGFGFVMEDDGGDELEFHWTALTAGRLDQLALGQRVQFEIKSDQRDKTRRRAVNLRLLSD